MDHGDKEIAIRGIDLEVRVTTRRPRGQWALDYFLHSPNGIVPFHHHEIRGPDLQVDADDFRSRLMEKLEGLQRGLDVGQTPLLKEETEEKLVGVGHWLYEQLFPSELRRAYRTFREQVTTLQITSQEPWIPWELIRPYDEDGGELMCPFGKRA